MRLVDLVDVDQDAGAEGDAVEREAVAAQGGLGLGAADQIVPDILVELEAGRLDQLVQVEKLAVRLVLHRR